MNIKSILMASLVTVSCFNDHGSEPKELPDQEAIQNLCLKITSAPIDSISYISDESAYVYFNTRIMDPYQYSFDRLYVYTRESLSEMSAGQVVVGKWATKFMEFNTVYQISLTPDSIPFRALSDEQVEIDSLRTIVTFLRDSMICHVNTRNTQNVYDQNMCFKAPIESFSEINMWNVLNDTISFRMSFDYGVLWVRWYHGVIFSEIDLLHIDCSIHQPCTVNPAWGYFK